MINTLDHSLPWPWARAHAKAWSLNPPWNVLGQSCSDKVSESEISHMAYFCQHLHIAIKEHLRVTLEEKGEEGRHHAVISRMNRQGGASRPWPWSDSLTGTRKLVNMSIRILYNFSSGTTSLFPTASLMSHWWTACLFFSPSKLESTSQNPCSALW